MPEGYETVVEAVDVSGRTWMIERLKDRSQFHDPDGVAAAMGVHENVWPIFGILWPAAPLLVQALEHFDLEGAKVLELGCGLALVSLALHARGVDVVASDIHPLAEDFLARNCERNALPPLPFKRIDWTQHYPDLPKFDVIIASDVLYEDGMAPDIVQFIDTHSASGIRVFVTDPGRSGRRNRFTRMMLDKGFTVDEWQDEANTKGRIMTYARGLS